MTQLATIGSGPLISIREAATASGLPPKTIRYYEEIGIVRPARGANGYRVYHSRDVETLRFVQRARSLGFSIGECRQLLSIYRDHNRASADAKAIAERHIEDIDRKITELEGLRRTLRHLADACHGDERPDCPILDDIARVTEDKR